MHFRLRKCEKLPQTYRKLAEHLYSFAKLSVNLRCPALLARRRALLALSAIPCNISRIHTSLFSEELVFPRHACCVLSRLCCNGHSLLLSSYLSRIGRIESPCCNACNEHPSQYISHLILHCPATDSLPRLLFGDPLSLYDLWSRP